MNPLWNPFLTPRSPPRILFCFLSNSVPHCCQLWNGMNRNVSRNKWVKVMEQDLTWSTCIIPVILATISTFWPVVWKWSFLLPRPQFLKVWTVDHWPQSHRWWEGSGRIWSGLRTEKPSLGTASWEQGLCLRHLQTQTHHHLWAIAGGSSSTAPTRWQLGTLGGGGDRYYSGFSMFFLKLQMVLGAFPNWGNLRRRLLSLGWFTVLSVCPEAVCRARIFRNVKINTIKLGRCVKYFFPFIKTVLWPSQLR